MKNRIEFKARFKKVDLFNNTLHLIVFPKGSLKIIGNLYKIEDGQKIKITISILND